MRAGRGAVMAMLLAVAASTAWAQSTTAQSVNAAAVPEPYTQDEFPSWAVGLRRFEIVSLGAFPILLFYTRFAFDVKRFIDNDFDATYAPWPFKNESSYVPSDDEQITSVVTAAGLSMAFGALDAFLVWRASLE